MASPDFGREHTGSYYAATRNILEDYPALDSDHRCDVVVVGGGFTGVSTTLYLAERGYDVTLVEANRIGWGASGRNGGQLIDGFTRDGIFREKFGDSVADMVVQMGVECRDIVVDRIEKYDIDCDLKLGYIDVAARNKPAELRGLEEHLETRIKNNFPYEMRMIGPNEIGDWVNSDKYVAGVSNQGNGHLHPLNLCAGEAKAAVGLGAKIFEQTRVTKIRHGANPVVETEFGNITANKVVLAGNAYLRDAEPKLRNKVFPAGTYVIATEPLSDQQVNELIPADVAFCEQCVALNYFRLSMDKRLLFGGMCNYSGIHPRDITASMKPRLTEVFPSLEDIRIDYEWGGNIAISINRCPQFGRIQGNTYFVQGYSGHGIAPTHLAGKMLADVICGDSEQFDMFTKINHMSIPGGKWFAGPAVALGMSYFRLKEMLS
ncbi:MAG: NAD(P)/FAD-dependent oxidoreductase [Woeseiaceae bacterium]